MGEWPKHFLLFEARNLRVSGQNLSGIRRQLTVSCSIVNVVESVSTEITVLVMEKTLTEVWVWKTSGMTLKGPRNSIISIEERNSSNRTYGCDGGCYTRSYGGDSGLGCTKGGASTAVFHWSRTSEGIRWYIGWCESCLTFAKFGKWPRYYCRCNN